MQGKLCAHLTVWVPESASIESYLLQPQGAASFLCQRPQISAFHSCCLLLAQIRKFMHVGLTRRFVFRAWPWLQVQKQREAQRRRLQRRETWSASRVIWPWRFRPNWCQAPGYCEARKCVTWRLGESKPSRHRCRGCCPSDVQSCSSSFLQAPRGALNECFLAIWRTPLCAGKH